MPTTAFAYLDESGDLGWKFDQPFGEGGSSRFFVIAIAIGINEGFRRFGKVQDALRKLQGWTSTNEKKWKTISDGARLAFCQLAAKELANNPETLVLVAVCHKENAPDFMRQINVREMHSDLPEADLQKLEARYRGRSHLVYSMMAAETLGEHLPELDNLTYCPDDLNESVRTLEHIISYRLQFQDQRDIELRRVDAAQPMKGGLAFADMIAGAVLEAFERGDESYLNIIRPYIKIKEFQAPQDTAPAGETTPVLESQV